MRGFKYVLPLVAAAWGLLAPAVYADNFDSYEKELNDRDFDALRDFIISKRTINVEEKDCNLTISGDVRSEWRHMTEKQRGEKMRGGHARSEIDGLPVSCNDFDIEVNLRFDYVCDRAWAVTRIQYDNSAGVQDNGWECCPHDASGNPVCCSDSSLSQSENSLSQGPQVPCNCFDPEGFHGSGTCDALCLKDAYFGYNICTNGDTRFDIEIGRHSNLYKVFESEIQFLSRMDGILLKYSSQWECVADWYIQAAGFVVDERVNHFAWVAEIGFENICDTPFTVKYSYIDWKKHGRNRCCVHNPRGFRFQNSQIYLAYDTKDWFCFPSKFFGAFLWNHAASKLHHEFSRHHHHSKKQNHGWYVGFELGRVVREGDWAFKLQYQVVQANSIPNDDVSGIGRGNVSKNSYTVNGLGNTNYKGWKLEALYAITDNLTINPQFEWSTADDKNIGGSHKYSKVELEAVYAF